MLGIASSFFNDFLRIIVVMQLITMLLLIFSERSDPNKLVVWMLIIVLAPIIGTILYISIGQTFYAKHAFRLKGLKDEEVQNFTDFESGLLESEPDLGTKRFATVIRGIGGKGYSSNNEVKLFTTGEGKYASLSEDLENSTKFIHMEYFIVRNDDISNKIMDILIRKASEGVEVRLMIDAFGVGKAPKKSIHKLRKVGGKVTFFHSMVVLLSPKKNNRNHRKIAVIDGDIGYCGGFNIGDEYLGKGRLGYWRDTSARVRGAAALILESRFEMDWNYASRSHLSIDNPIYCPESAFEKFGSTGIQVVSGGPDSPKNNPVRLQYLTLINEAKGTLNIQTPYFIPDESLSDALKLAAARGVDVKVMIPDKPDHPFVYWNNIFSANDVMASGVRVFMYNRGFVHSKAIVADGKYCSVGSANMDDRSLVLDFETNLMIYSEEIGRQMDEAFAKDLEHCTEYTMGDYASLGFGPRFRIGISRIFRNLS